MLLIFSTLWWWLRTVVMWIPFVLIYPLILYFRSLSIFAVILFVGLFIFLWPMLSVVICANYTLFHSFPAKLHRITITMDRALTKLTLLIVSFLRFILFLLWQLLLIAMLRFRLNLRVVFIIMRMIFFVTSVHLNIRRCRRHHSMRRLNMTASHYRKSSIRSISYSRTIIVSEVFWLSLDMHRTRARLH